MTTIVTAWAHAVCSHASSCVRPCVIYMSHTYTRTHTNTHVCTQTYAHTHTRACTHTISHTRPHSHTYMHTHRAPRRCSCGLADQSRKKHAHLEHTLKFEFHFVGKMNIYIYIYSPFSSLWVRVWIWVCVKLIVAAVKVAAHVD